MELIPLAVENMPMNSASTSGQISPEQAIGMLKALPEYESLLSNIYADDDVVQAALRFAGSEEFRCVASWASSAGIRAPAKVLDLGAGRGIASLAWTLRGYSVTAVEPDPSCLVGAGAIRELVCRTCISVEIVEEVGERLPFAAASFDLVYVRQALHHATDLSQMCREIQRILRPRGVLIATREHVVSGPRQLATFLESHSVHQLAGGEMAYKLTSYKSALRAAGFKRIHTYGPMQSPVNYFPATSETVRSASRTFISGICGARVGTVVAKLPFYHTAWALLASAFNRDPGRMYSFVARK
jgi:ubiquinone/menaquinone biosynthesis C-methylase UbiE